MKVAWLVNLIMLKRVKSLIQCCYQVDKTIINHSLLPSLLLSWSLSLLFCCCCCYCCCSCCLFLCFSVKYSSFTWLFTVPRLIALCNFWKPRSFYFQLFIQRRLQFIHRVPTWWTAWLFYDPLLSLSALGRNLMVSKSNFDFIENAVCFTDDAKIKSHCVGGDFK